MPPRFENYHEGGGKNPPHCFCCAHASILGNEIVCMEYGAKVLIYSSCETFRQKENGLPIILEEELKKRFPVGVVDLRKKQP